MANRKLTVLNPNGYQEILQSSDRLILDGQSRFDGSTEFTSSAIFSSATFSGNITINGTPSATLMQQLLRLLILLLHLQR